MVSYPCFGTGKVNMLANDNDTLGQCTMCVQESISLSPCRFLQGISLLSGVPR